MFIQAIEKVAGFTRPIHTVMRRYKEEIILPGASTIFFVNREGCAVTCKHVAELLIQSEHLNQRYNEFKTERQRIIGTPSYEHELNGLELKYKFNPSVTVQIKNNFVESIDKISGFDIHLHPTLDLAIVRFKGFSKLLYEDCARFPKSNDAVKQGKFLCRLGFPFPEFNNFQYNTIADDIEWTNTGVQTSPRFPIEGMATRFLADQQHGLYGIEMSTPGLKGQSGGPLFDSDGLVHGMQFSTKHLHLGFDIENMEVMVNNSTKKISDYSFIHLGQCIHARVIKAFLKQHGVVYYERD